MKLVEDLGDTPRTPVSFCTAISCLFGEYQQHGTEPAVAKQLRTRRVSDTEVACSSAKQGRNKRYQREKSRKC